MELEHKRIRMLLFVIVFVLIVGFMLWDLNSEISEGSLKIRGVEPRFMEEFHSLPLTKGLAVVCI